MLVLSKQIPEGDVPTTKFLNVNFALRVAWNWTLSFSTFYVVKLQLYTHFVIKIGTIQIIVTRTNSQFTCSWQFFIRRVLYKLNLYFYNCFYLKLQIYLKNFLNQWSM